MSSSPLATVLLEPAPGRGRISSAATRELGGRSRRIPIREIRMYLVVLIFFGLSGSIMLKCNNNTAFSGNANRKNAVIERWIQLFRGGVHKIEKSVDRGTR